MKKCNPILKYYIPRLCMMSFSNEDFIRQNSNISIHFLWLFIFRFQIQVK